MVALGLGFSWLIGRSVTRPLNGLADVMKRLAAGDTSARIPATHARDEIGEMARTVIVFRDSMIERESLAQTPSQIAAKELRSETISQTIVQFKHSVENALGKLRAAAMKLEMSSVRSQQDRRHGVLGGPFRRTARHRRLRTSPPPRARSRNWRSRSARSRRRRRSPPTWPSAPCQKPGAPSSPCRNWAMPRPASARWSA